MSIFKDDFDFLFSSDSNDSDSETQFTVRVNNKNCFGRKKRRKTNLTADVFAIFERYSSDSDETDENTANLEDQIGAFIDGTRKLIPDSSQDELLVKWYAFWTTYGQQLVEESWIAKYKDYIDPSYLDNAHTINGSSRIMDDSCTDCCTIDFESNDKINYNAQWNKLWFKHYKEEYILNCNEFWSKAVGMLYDVKSVVPITNASVTDNADSCVAKIDHNIETIETHYDPETVLMESMGLPTSFTPKAKRHKKERKPISVISKQVPPEMSSKNIEAEIETALNSMGIKFKAPVATNITGQVIAIKNILRKTPKHTYFNDGDNQISTDITTTNQCVELLSNNSINDSGEANDVDNNDMKEVDSSNSIEEFDAPPKTKHKKRRLPPEIKTNRRLRYFYIRRHSLFSRYDEGIMLDEESWYSVTPEKIAKSEAKKCKCDIIIDAFCGAGGNAIQFAFTCNKVIAIDIDPKKVELAKHNAEIYGVSSKIEFIVADFIKIAPTLKADVVFLSPPWGGLEYAKNDVYDLEAMLKPIPFSNLISVARKVTNNIAAYLPKNSDHIQILRCAGDGGFVESVKYYLEGRHIAITIYYGDLVTNTAKKKAV